MNRPLLPDRITLITGAARGLGRAIALRAAREGGRLAISDRDRGGLTETGNILRELGAETLCVPGCLTDTAFPALLIEACKEHYGGLDLLINNAGMEHRASVSEHTPDTWNKVMAVNLDAPFLITRAAIPLLADSPAPAVVNIASTAVTGFRRQVAYDSSKGGILSMTRSMAVDLAEHGIRVNAVCPGFIETEMVASDPELSRISQRFCRSLPAGRPGKPEEIAAAVIWLGSAEASYITGQGIFVDGGWIRN